MREDLGDEADKLLANLKEDIENAKKAALKSFEESRDKVVDKFVQDKKEEKAQPDSETKTSQERKRPSRRRPRRPKTQGG